MDTGGPSEPKKQFTWTKEMVRNLVFSLILLGLLISASIIIVKRSFDNPFSVKTCSIVGFVLQTDNQHPRVVPTILQSNTVTNAQDLLQIFGKEKNSTEFQCMRLLPNKTYNLQIIDETFGTHFYQNVTSIYDASYPGCDRLDRPFGLWHVTITDSTGRPSYTEASVADLADIKSPPYTALGASLILSEKHNGC